MKKRVTHIDFARAIGIILILSSHIVCMPTFTKSSSLNLMWNILGSFYVPFFFILSGIFISPYKKSTNNINLISYITKTKGILNLLFLFTTFLTLQIILFYIIKHKINFSLGPLWFLIVLILNKLIFNIILKFSFTNQIFIIIIMGLIGYYIGFYGHNYFYLGATATCMPFYAIGYYLKNIILLKDFNIKRCILFFCIWLLGFIRFYEPQNLSINSVSQNPISFYLTAISGSFCLIEICKITQIKPLLTYRKYSIVPMCTHWSILMIIQLYIIPANWNEWLIVFVITFVTSYLSIYLFVNKQWNLISFYK